MTKVIRDGVKKLPQGTQKPKRVQPVKDGKSGISPNDVEDPDFEIDAELNCAGDRSDAEQFAREQGW